MANAAVAAATDVGQKMCSPGRNVNNEHNRSVQLVKLFRVPIVLAGVNSVIFHCGLIRVVQQRSRSWRRETSAGSWIGTMHFTIARVQNVFGFFTNAAFLVAALITAT